MLMCHGFIESCGTVQSVKDSTEQFTLQIKVSHFNDHMYIPVMERRRFVTAAYN